MVELAEHLFEAAPTSVKQARDFARETLTAWKLDACADAVLLCVSELVTNALTHGMPFGRGYLLTQRSTEVRSGRSSGRRSRSPNLSGGFDSAGGNVEAGSLGIAVRLTSSVVVPVVRKLFARPGAGAGLVERPVRVSGLVAWCGEHRTLTEEDVRKLVGELVRRAERAEAHERVVPEGEAGALAEALTRTLLALGDIGIEDVEAVRLGHRSFARLLRQHVPAGVERELSAEGSALYASLLELCCLHVLHFFTQRSTFVARTLVEQSRALGDVVGKLDLLLERMPHQSVVDAAFERRYSEYMAGKHGTLTIFGLDLRTQAKWPLDSAYLSLEAVPTEEDWERQEPVRHGPRRADEALEGQDRVLLRGVAGSGKTTLVQWLAVSAARQDVTSCMPHLLGKVPFVLPLRTVVRRGELPSGPGGFLRSTGHPLAGAQPEGWADRVLGAGRALLLVDGLDEIPERERERTREWLRDLLIAYPDNLWLVTSRPSAVGDGWLGGEGFHELTLNPMTPSEVGTFVGRWHDAARAVAADEEERGRLDGFEAALREALRAKRDLSRLATNPLMCGMICALHRERRAHLPQGRKELYDAALSMLLERRDTERDIGTPDGIGIPGEAQIRLLQRLAYWLIRNGRVELEYEHAAELIGEALPAMPTVAEQGDAGQVLTYLLIRGGLLRQPTADTVEFVHRTFQDYLGAKAAVEARDFDLMVNNAHDDQWEDVVRMAVAHARVDERALILRKLLARGGTRTDLLAMACLEHATELDPAVREEVRERAGALIPPTNHDQARALAEAGPIALELLPGPEGLSDEVAEAVVITASRIATEPAIPVLAKFRSHPSPRVRRQLAWAWNRYDTGRYADEIISHLEPNGLYFVVRTRAELRALGAMGGRPLIQVDGELTGEDLFDALGNGCAITELRLRSGIRDLEGFHWLTSLRSLRLDHLPETGLRGLSRHRHLEVVNLMLAQSELTSADWDELARLPNLYLLLLKATHLRAATAPLTSVQKVALLGATPQEKAAAAPLFPNARIS